MQQLGLDDSTPPPLLSSCSQSIGKMRSDTLFWPKDDGNMRDSSNCGSGYVVGWQEFDEARASRTTICAAILPDASSAAGSSSAGRGYGLDQVNDAIDALSARCVCPNDHGENSDSKGGGQVEHEMCLSLQVVGRWENKGEKRRSRSTRGSSKRGAKREELKLPVIAPLPSGDVVWFQDDGLAMSNESSNESSNTFRELIWYHRHGGRAALGHYKLDGDTPLTSFRQILQRLNESQNIARELIGALEGRGAPATSGLTNSDDSEEDELSMPSNYCGAFISRVWEKTKLRSLTAISLACGFRSGPVIMSHIPLLRGLYLLIFYLKMRNGSRSSNGISESREDRALKDLKTVSNIGRALVDGIVGALLGLILISMPGDILKLVEHVWLKIHVQLLRENISWLETFPVGFKLNVPLTTNMGREILLVVSAYEDALALAFGSSSVQFFLVKALALIGVVFGFSVVSALVFDAIQLLTLHIKIISGTFCRMFRALLYTQSSLWKLFRGKKLNPLRHRTDTLRYDFMQLFLGMILFTISVFLFTTLLIYYAFFTTVALSVAACGVLVWILHQLILELPLAACLLRILYPNRFPRTVYFSHSGENANVIHKSTLVHTSTLVSVPHPIGKVFSTAYGPPFSSFLSQLPSFIGELVTGRPVTIIEACLDSTRQKEKELQLRDSFVSTRANI